MNTICRLRVSLILLVAVAVVACGRRDDAIVPAGADAVYRNGKLYTVDENRSWAEAVAITGGRIVYVGTDDGVSAHIGSATAVVDLQGRMMLPGFQDAHVHPVSGGVEAGACDLNDLDGLSAYRTAIADYAKANPQEPWILGGGWSMSEFGPGGSPSKAILDELVPDRPVYLESLDGHTGWANSMALEIAGISRETADPVDGRIDRDPETGELVGSLQEGAMDLLEAHIPERAPEDYIEGLKYSVAMLNRYGITSIQEADAEREYLPAYKALEARGELTLRVVLALEWDDAREFEQVQELVELRRDYSGDLVKATSVKIFQDGVMENYTAAMLEPYLSPNETRGISLVEPELLKRVVTRLDAEGFQVHFHAIGDAAIRQSLDAVEEALVQNGESGHRHHISHLELIDPQDIPRFGELGVVANFQPLWAYPDAYITDLTIPFIGKERARWLYPIRSVQDAGGMLAFGSDWSVSTANPYPQIETAVLRKFANDDDGVALTPEERIDLPSAIAAFTINAAFVNHRETDTGSIEVGKLADLIVLDQNLFDVEPERISDTKTLLTLFGGKSVHGDPQAL